VKGNSKSVRLVGKGIGINVIWLESCKGSAEKLLSRAFIFNQLTPLRGQRRNMNEEKEKLSLSNIKGGAAIELVDRALAKVFANINDINTTEGEREIVLKIKIKPDEDRTLAMITMNCSTKLAGQASEKTTADLRLDEQCRPVAYERINRQQPLFPVNITEMKGGNS